MSQFQNEYGSNVTRTDEYGNPVRQQTDQYGNPIAPSHTQTDQYGNPVHHPGTGGAYGHATDTGHHGTTTTAGHHGTAPTTGPTFTTSGLHGKEHHGLGHNSSEDEVDEFGVRRKKGITEKIKEKIPGVCGQGQRDEQAMSTTTPGGHATHAYGHGHGHRDEQAMPTTTPGGAAYGYEEHREKKGIMDKIKEKLPGHN